MQDTVVDKPYHFVAPHRGNFWPSLFLRYLPRYLDRTFGITSVSCQGVEHLAQSVAAGHGILLAPNHCRPCDPMVLGALSRQVGRLFFIMASSHLFAQSRRMRWLLPRCGAFSVYREGLDKAAVDTAVDILAEARRPLIIFPEGVISRHNDELNSLMEGTAMIARLAAKRRAKCEPPRQVMVHPVALRYSFHGDLSAALEPVLTRIETRLSWLPQDQLPLLERIYKIGRALLALKEMEYLGHTQDGSVEQRISALIDHLLMPLEQKWLGRNGQGSVIARVKRLRTALLPELIKAELGEEENAQRWRELTVLYYAQQLSFYPPDYLAAGAPPERLLETVERFEEDLTDVATIHRPMAASIRVGPAIEVSPHRERGSEVDPLLEQIEQSLRDLLGI